MDTGMNEQNNLGVVQSMGYGNYSYPYRNAPSDDRFIGPIVPFVGGLIGGLAVGALTGQDNYYVNPNYNVYPYYGGYPYPYYTGYGYPSPYYYGGYNNPYWR